MNDNLKFFFRSLLSSLVVKIVFFLFWLFNFALAFLVNVGNATTDTAFGIMEKIIIIAYFFSTIVAMRLAFKNERIVVNSKSYLSKIINFSIALYIITLPPLLFWWGIQSRIIYPILIDLLGIVVGSIWLYYRGKNK